MRALVAGGAGFIGNEVCGQLLAQGHQVLCVDNLVTGAMLNVERLAHLPGFEFRRTDGLLTNFHLPGSTLLALVMAFAGVEEIRKLYELAIEERYRFYSFGDAMLIL